MAVDVKALNDLAIKFGNLYCYNCRRATGVYHIQLYKLYVKTPGRKKMDKVYECKDCRERRLNGY
jgi:hypothetical protein